MRHTNAKPLSPRQIVLVAKDVVKQIKSAEMEVRRGSYVLTSTGGGSFEQPNDQYNDLQDLITDGLLKNCKVCARGAMIIAKAKLFNDCPLEGHTYTGCAPGTTCIDVNSVGSTRSLEVFGGLGLEVEAAFEGWPAPKYGNYSHSLGIKPTKATGYGDWVKEYPNDKTRLVALMENLIRNKGVFKVKQLRGKPPTPAQYRIQLAKDALDRVILKQLVIKPQHYVRITKANGDVAYIGDSAQLDEVLQNQDLTCSTCALGGLLSSYALEKDATTCRDASCRRTVVDRLNPIFGVKQLALIELAFEVDPSDGRVMVGDDGHVGIRDFPDDALTMREKAACRKFFRRNRKDHTERFKLIMRNIIKNKGKFVLPAWTFGK